MKHHTIHLLTIAFIPLSTFVFVQVVAWTDMFHVECCFHLVSLCTVYSKFPFALSSWGTQPGAHGRWHTAAHSNGASRNSSYVGSLRRSSLIRARACDVKHNQTLRGFGVVFMLRERSEKMHDLNMNVTLQGPTAKAMRPCS